MRSATAMTPGSIELSVSFTRAPAFDQVLFTAPDETPITETWKKNPLWQKIPAVARGRVYQFNRDNWTRGRGPLALKLMVKEAIDSRLLQDAAPAGNFKY